VNTQERQYLMRLEAERNYNAAIQPVVAERLKIHNLYAQYQITPDGKVHSCLPPAQQELDDLLVRIMDMHRETFFGKEAGL